MSILRKRGQRALTRHKQKNHKRELRHRRKAKARRRQFAQDTAFSRTPHERYDSVIGS